MVLTYILSFWMASWATADSLDELLSYACAKSVAAMVDLENQPGPIFTSKDLILTSVEASDGSPLLIVSAGRGLYSARLPKTGINRLRLQVSEQVYYLSYLHEPKGRSRVFELSKQKPILGKSETDYTKLQLQTNSDLLANLDYAILQTSESVLAALTEGQVRRQQFVHHKVDNCEHLARKNPSLGKGIRRQLDVVERMVIGPKRMPASFKISSARK